MGIKPYASGLGWYYEDDSTTAAPSHNFTYNPHYLNPNGQQGWICPRCGRVNAPWVSRCNCTRTPIKITCDSNIPDACRYCSNHPSNGGSGICFCTLGTAPATCTDPTTVSTSYTTTTASTDGGAQSVYKARTFNGTPCIN